MNTDTILSFLMSTDLIHERAIIYKLSTKHRTKDWRRSL